MLLSLGEMIMPEYSERRTSVASYSAIDLIDSLIMDATKDLTASRNRLAETVEIVEKCEAKIAWLNEERLRHSTDPSKMRELMQRKPTEVPTMSVEPPVFSTRNAVDDDVLDIALNPKMKLADAVRTIVRDSGALGAKTSEVAQELVQIGHPISTAPDLSKRVGSALCALKPKATSPARKQRAGKNDLFRDDETGRFYSPEAWMARQS